MDGGRALPSTPRVPFHRAVVAKQSADLLLLSELLGTPRKAFWSMNVSILRCEPEDGDFVGILKAHEIVQCGLDPMIGSIER